MKVTKESLLQMLLCPFLEAKHCIIYHLHASINVAMTLPAYRLLSLRTPVDMLQLPRSQAAESNF